MGKMNCEHELRSKPAFVKFSADERTEGFWCQRCSGYVNIVTSRDFEAEDAPGVVLEPEYPQGLVGDSTFVEFVEENVPSGAQEPATNGGIGEALASTYLVELLDLLTPKQRFVVELSWGLRGGRMYSFVEISEAMGTSFQGVHGLYTRAMRILRVESCPYE